MNFFKLKSCHLFTPSASGKLPRVTAADIKETAGASNLPKNVLTMPESPDSNLITGSQTHICQQKELSEKSPPLLSHNSLQIELPAGVQQDSSPENIPTKIQEDLQQDSPENILTKVQHDSQQKMVLPAIQCDSQQKEVLAEIQHDSLQKRVLCEIQFEYQEKCSMTDIHDSQPMNLLSGILCELQQKEMLSGIQQDLQQKETLSGIEHDLQQKKVLSNIEQSKMPDRVQCYDPQLKNLPRNMNARSCCQCF